MRKKKTIKPKKTKCIVNDPRRVYIAHTKTMGRGVFANMDYKKGDLIFCTHLLRLSPGDNHFLSNTALQYYTFDSPSEYSGDSYLALGEGSLINNDSYSANTQFDIDENELLVVFTAVTDIKAGDQLFANYGWD